MVGQNTSVICQRQTCLTSTRVHGYLHSRHIMKVLVCQCWKPCVAVCQSSVPIAPLYPKWLAVQDYCISLKTPTPCSNICKKLWKTSSGVTRRSLTGYSMLLRFPGSVVPKKPLMYIKNWQLICNESSAFL